MKKLILLTSLFIANNCLANELHHYDEIKNAVLKGKNIHIVIDFGKCSTEVRIPESVLAGVFTPREIMVSYDHIATSMTHFTINNPAFPQKAIYEFVDYKITPANDVILSSQVLDAATYTPLSTTQTLTCKLDTGAKIYS